MRAARRLRSNPQRRGYRAVGVDPAAPDGPEYEQATFEELRTPEPFDAVVACTSLHHVDDLDAIVERIGLALRSGGAIVVVEWAWEQFDERTARWCFERLAPTLPGTEPTWLHRHREAWASLWAILGHLPPWVGERGPG